MALQSSIMTAFCFSAKRALTSLRFRPPVITPVRPVILPSDIPIEEELVFGYDPRHFYPVNPGEIFHDMYEMTAKLGCGSCSTVWLARDTWWYASSPYYTHFPSDVFRQKWRSNRYVAVKVNTCDFIDASAANHELNISRRIAQANPSHGGLSYVRTNVDSFSISGPHGNHICLGYEAMREPLWLFERRCKNGRLTLDLLKGYLRLLLRGLDYLHSECHIVHTGRLQAMRIC